MMLTLGLLALAAIVIYLFLAYREATMHERMVNRAIRMAEREKASRARVAAKLAEPDAPAVTVKAPPAPDRTVPAHTSWRDNRDDYVAPTMPYVAPFVPYDSGPTYSSYSSCDSSPSYSSDSSSSYSDCGSSSASCGCD